MHVDDRVNVNERLSLYNIRAIQNIDLKNLRCLCLSTQDLNEKDEIALALSMGPQIRESEDEASRLPRPAVRAQHRNNVLLLIKH